MNLNDIIALAKQGYKPSDIKELISLSEMSNGAVETPPEETRTEEPPVDEPNAENDTTTPENEPMVDYKKLYEESQSQISEMKTQIEKIQKDNTRQNMQGDTPSAQDTLNDIVKSFM